MTDSREVGLPKWAQAELGRLRDRISSLEAKALIQPSTTNTRVSGGLNLPDGARIEFSVGDGHEFTVRIADSYYGKAIVVRHSSPTDGRMAIYPQVSNEIIVAVVS